MLSLEKAINASTPVTGMRFDGDDLEEFHIGEVEFRECRFSACKFDFAMLRAAKFIGCSFDHCSFREAVFIGCQFSEGDTGCEWRYCDLNKTEFRQCNLSLNKLTGCEAYLLSLLESAAQGLKLDVNVQRKVRTQVIAGGIHIKNSKLQYAEFTPANLQESIFESSDLRDVCFAGCDLSHASFRGSGLNNADFSGATLDHADLSHATFDTLDFHAMASFHAATVTRDQHEAIVSSMGLISAG
jgi:fluoroquinolone resistance protein